MKKKKEDKEEKERRNRRKRQRARGLFDCDCDCDYDACIHTYIARVLGIQSRNHRMGMAWHGVRGRERESIALGCIGLEP